MAYQLRDSSPSHHISQGLPPLLPPHHGGGQRLLLNPPPPLGKACGSPGRGSSWGGQSRAGAAAAGAEPGAGSGGWRRLCAVREPREPRAGFGGGSGEGTRSLPVSPGRSPLGGTRHLPVQIPRPRAGCEGAQGLNCPWGAERVPEAAGCWTAPTSSRCHRRATATARAAARPNSCPLPPRWPPRCPLIARGRCLRGTDSPGVSPG